MCLFSLRKSVLLYWGSGLAFMILYLPLNALGFVLNDPYPACEAMATIYYTSFSEQPKTLDPAKSYVSNEYQFIAQLVEPLLQYDYLKRPYTLTPLTATALPTVQYENKAGYLLATDQEQQAAYSLYTIHLQQGILYQPHPAFAKNSAGLLEYHDLSPHYLDDQGITRLADFKKTGTRALVVDDYIYQIKRLANPSVNSPIYGLMSEYIVGFKEFAASLPKGGVSSKWLDLRSYSLKGVKKIDDYTFQIRIKGVYPQFLFWLAMPFFSPIPWEVEQFYAEPDMEDRNIELGWYPVGTGPYMLVENNPNARMVLLKNPNYRVRTLPINKAIYTLEKESIPRWTKFLQGYYDLSLIGSDGFDKAIQISNTGSPTLTKEMKEHGIRLTKEMEPTLYYLGFNQLDPIVGGHDLRAQRLRQALSIVINYDEYRAIFLNGRGQSAHSPIPPGIVGYRREMINPVVYVRDGQGVKRRSLAEAKALLRAAGYPKGRDPATGKPLLLHYDVPLTGGPDEKAQLNWMQKQVATLGIALDVRATQYNRFQEKMRTGNAQLFSWGWSADYPDPENFLFLLYSRNGKVAHGGENAANYHNERYDRLFEEMKHQPNGSARQAVIDKMVALLQQDAPWIWGLSSESLLLSHDWMSPIKTNPFSYNTLKYREIDAPKRAALRAIWNKPVLWPLGILFLLLVGFIVPFWGAYKRRQEAAVSREGM